jgi:hypothetical protein
MYDTRNKTYKELAMDISFWRNLNPELTITEYSQSDWGPYKLSTAQKKDLRESLIEEGYFHLHSVFDPADLKKMADAAKVLQREQWPPVYCFVYDEFWHFQNRYRDIISEMLGKEFVMMPNFWVFYISPDNESKGWEPHRDRQKVANLRPDGTPLSMVFWTPLTDAQPLNGCMYILPAHRDPHYKTNPNLSGVEHLQDIRALPAPVGSVLGWNETVFHWGARASKRADEPRIAISTAYQSTECGAFETPLIQPGHLLPFELRVGLIAQQFDRFSNQNTYAPAVVELAHELSPLLEENIRILDDGWHYWELLKNEPDSQIPEDIPDCATNQLPTPPRDFEKGRWFKGTLEPKKRDGSSRSLNGNGSANTDGNGKGIAGGNGNGAHVESDTDDKSKPKGWLGKLGLK